MNNLYRTIIGLMLLPGLLQCRKDNAKLLGPGILLTVDKPPDTWYPIRDFMAAHHAKLTFYIEAYQQLPDSSRQKMKEMMALGHEMAHHTSTHAHGDAYVKQYGMDAYMQNEILSMTDSMRKDGFNPVTFAYPFGDCTVETDARLLEHFNSLRKVLGTYLNKHLADMDQLYFRYGDIKLFYGTGIDVRYNHSIEEVYEALEKAKNSRQTISLYCHFLNYNPKDFTESYIPEEFLKKVITRADELGLRFYTASEVSSKRW